MFAGATEWPNECNSRKLGPVKTPRETLIAEPIDILSRLRSLSKLRFPAICRFRCASAFLSLRSGQASSPVRLCRYWLVGAWGASASSHFS